LVDGDADIGLHAGIGKEGRVRAHAYGHDDERGGQKFAIRQPHRKFRRSGAAAGPDAFHLGIGEHANTLVGAPASEHAAGGLVHHARDHARGEFDDGQIAADLMERLQHDAADEAGTDKDDIGSRSDDPGDRAGVFERPAGVHARQLGAFDRRHDR